MKLKSTVILLTLISSFFMRAEEFCQLQPQMFDGNKDSLKEFETNIEEALTEIYQKEYPRVAQESKDLDVSVRELNRVSRAFFNKYVERGGLRHQTKEDGSKVTRREFFSSVMDEGIHTEDEWNRVLEELSFVEKISFEEFQKDRVELNQLKDRVQILEDQISPMQAPYFLYPPQLSYSFRGGQISYGDLRVEAFFQPPKEDLFKLPFLNIGFGTDSNTVIYMCLHFDSFDAQKNRLYIYFLNTTKFFVLDWKDFFTDFNLMVRSLVHLRKPPEAQILPLPFEVSPVSDEISGFLKTTNSFVNQVNTLQNVTSVMNRLEFLDLTTQLNPVLAIVLNNVSFGIKGLVVHPERLQLHYAGSSLYGLINFNLGQFSQRTQFSSFMNVLTWEKDSEELEGSQEPQDPEELQ